MSALIGRGGLLDELFRDVNPGFYIRPLHGDGLPAPSQIRIDVKENEGAYIVEAEVPGVAKEDIQVSIDGNVVSLRAEVTQRDEQTQGGKVLRSERFYGAVERKFQLPADIDAQQANARYDNGVLCLTLPKKQGGQTRRLTVE
ncbi:Hsp20/alpha crystallin family protein [Comamonas endophytica]|uniref:Hsp20/alpha crystallin family protein n=1 Tax=Comamonas endophytica TaxID=2949090 RepID=A0ABY6GCE6_9BURK|nr:MULTISPECIES: Hsp20/alpha crystallin family protein [unclassified Acidovorax]MCD2513611.1 Hsp20/alpha crystallin family protein [Acidovorax sp. D4N7]UYG52380.1 Hsp20/alpha crystallin family protein [Acidovorax sp. 5MLIR]